MSYKAPAAKYLDAYTHCAVEDRAADRDESGQRVEEEGTWWTNQIEKNGLVSAEMVEVVTFVQTNDRKGDEGMVSCRISE